jgi:large subunit ribosomal protein L10e
MGLRPGRSYHEIKNKPYTRISVHRPRKSYVKGVPASKIHQFEMGKKGKYPLAFNLVSKQDIQIRSNSLESARITTLKHLNKKLGENSFFFKILIYPHHVLRENSMATGAGADRFSQGMRKSFGKPIGLSARVKKGQKIMTVNADKNSEANVRKALKRATSKLSGSFYIKMVK